jgi:hypothetical protein
VFDTMNNPALIKRSWERCVVGDFNLSWESVSSVNARRALFALRKSNPEFWAELTQPRQDYDSESETSDSEDETENTDPEDEAPFDADNEDIDDDIDSAIDAQTLIDHVLAPAAPIPTRLEVTGLAEELNPGEVMVPVEPELGRGKRRRTANKLYADFVGTRD